MRTEWNKFVLSLAMFLSVTLCYGQEDITLLLDKKPRSKSHLMVAIQISKPILKVFEDESKVSDAFINDQVSVWWKKNRFAIRAGFAGRFSNDINDLDTNGVNNDLQEQNLDYSWDANLAGIYYLSKGLIFDCFAGPVVGTGETWQRQILEPGFDRITQEKGGFRWSAGIHYGCGLNLGKRLGAMLEGRLVYQNQKTIEQTKFLKVSELNQVKSDYVLHDISLKAPISLSLIYKFY